MKKRSSLCTTMLELYVAVDSKVVGLAPGHPGSRHLIVAFKNEFITPI
jgi:hypothetical protein